MPKPRSITTRRRKETLFQIVCVATVAVALAVLAVLLGSILVTGLPHLSWGFITRMASKDAARSGILPALLGSIYVCAICAATAVPIGIATAILLEEYRPKHPLAARIHGFINLNITNLAGVPSIVYGILGVTAFVQMFGLFGLAGQGHAIGQTWFDQYQGADGRSYFLPVEKDAPSQPAHESLTLYADTTATQNLAQVRFADAAQIDPLRASVKREMRTFDHALRAGIDATRGPRGRGTAHIDDPTAEKIVDDALAAATFHSEVQTLRAPLIEKVAALDGMDGRALRPARRALINLAVDQEVAHQLRGVLVAGTEPIRVDRRAWYYLSLPLGRGLVAGGLTLMLVILPVIIVASQESLRAVPASMREGVLAMGGTKWQAISKIVLPAAIPGICTGTILAMSRAIGEAAPLLILAGVVFISFIPANMMDNFTVMPLQIYNWASKPGDEFREVAATGIIVLLTVLLSFNAVAVLIRQKSQSPR